MDEGILVEQRLPREKALWYDAHLFIHLPNGRRPFRLPVFRMSLREIPVSFPLRLKNEEETHTAPREIKGDYSARKIAHRAPP